MRKSISNNKVLLYSGGMDSWLVDKIWKPDVKLYVDLKSRYSAEEIKRLPKDVEVVELDLSRWEREDSIIPLRNLYLISLATNYGNEICLGATAGDRVLDKSLMFAELTENLLTYLYMKQHWTEQRVIRINLDYKKYTKTQLLAMYLQQGGNIEEAFHASFSCYAPEDNGEPCWKCKPCFRKFIAFAMNGYTFPDEIKEKSLQYIRTGILPKIEAGTYGRKQEEGEILHVLTLYK